MTSLALRVFVTLWLALVLLAGASVGSLIWTAYFPPGGEHPTDTERSAAAALERGGRDGLTEWLRDAQSSSFSRIFVFDDADRDLLGRSTPRRLRRLEREASSSAASAVQLVPPEPFASLVTADGARYRLIILPPPGSAIAALARPGTRWLLAALVLLVMGAVSALLARTVTRPIHHLEIATQLITSGDFTTAALRATLGRNDEIGRLAGSINRLALHLRDLIGGRERLLRDLSHELRSPLARMQVALGLARQSELTTVNQLPRLEREVERLGELVGRILDLSRLDAGEVTWQLELIDLRDLVGDVLADAEFECQQRATRIEWHAPNEASFVSGDARWLRSAIENVLRNALRHGDWNPSLDVVLRHEGQSAVLRVSDHGPGVPEADLERIFEPFFRSRNGCLPTAGQGLGLAITARVLAGHGGTARACSSAGGGLTVELTLPLAASRCA